MSELVTDIVELRGHVPLADLLETVAEISGAEQAVVARGAHAHQPVPKPTFGGCGPVSVPIILAGGEHIGDLRAAGSRPLTLADPRLRLMFHCFARLIGLHVESLRRRPAKRLTLLNEHIIGNLRALFKAMLAPEVDGRALDPAIRQLAARAASQPHRMSTLVNDVLVYARGRLNDGTPGYIWKVDDLNARLQAVVTELKAARPKRTIITNISIDRPVDCDPARIVELASNLLRNALSHGSPEGPISFIASTSDNDLEIAVWNEGTCISSQALRNVFEPAWRPGTGRPAVSVGLHTCAKIVRAHLGTIGVTSSPTDGTQFVARIPVDRSLRLH